MIVRSVKPRRAVPAGPAVGRPRRSTTLPASSSCPHSARNSTSSCPRTAVRDGRGSRVRGGAAGAGPTRRGGRVIPMPSHRTKGPGVLGATPEQPIGPFGRWPELRGPGAGSRHRPGRTDPTRASDAGGVGRIRFCVSCEARLPRDASARRRYCDGVCRAQAYRDRRTSDQIMVLALMLGEAEWTGDERMIQLLTCPECGRITFAGASRRQDALYYSGRCRSRAWRRREARRARLRA